MASFCQQIESSTYAAKRTYYHWLEGSWRHCPPGCLTPEGVDGRV